MIMKSQEEFLEWIDKATPEEKRLFKKVEEFASCFEDMLFVSESSTYALRRCMTSDKPGGKMYEDGMQLPDELEYFSYTFFNFKVEKLEKYGGYYNHKTQTLCVPPEALDDDATILHELIHLHEFVINDLPMYFHDMLYWALYIELRKRIPMLDEIITDHAHLLTGSTLSIKGGTHDILFLLKSFDLDIKMSYPLGTVFAYGRAKEFKNYQYLRQE